jgi:hypothetical protein
MLKEKVEDSNEKIKRLDMSCPTAGPLGKVTLATTPESDNSLCLVLIRRFCSTGDAVESRWVAL